MGTLVEEELGMTAGMTDFADVLFSVAVALTAAFLLALLVHHITATRFEDRKVSVHASKCSPDQHLASTMHVLMTVVEKNAGAPMIRQEEWVVCACCGSPYTTARLAQDTRPRP